MSKMLLLDIETAPSKAYIWSLWTEPRSMTFVIEDWYIICWCAKWLDKKKVLSAALPDEKTYPKEQENDKSIMKKLWVLLDEADIIIAHNGKKFDIKRINTRFIIHGMPPPSPYKVIDTLNIARSTFAFMSNRLDDLGAFLKVGKKHETDFKLWKDCLEQSKIAWKRMVAYCKNDILLLEKVYYKIIPYATRTPNVAIYENRADLACTKCGSTNVQSRGYYYTADCKFRRFVVKEPNCII